MYVLKEYNQMQSKGEIKNSNNKYVSMFDVIKEISISEKGFTQTNYYKTLFLHRKQFNRF